MRKWRRRSPRGALSELDRQIIAALKKNGRVPFARLARELGVATSTVRQHYERLVERGVLRVTAITDPWALGYGVMAMIGLKVQGQHLEEAAQRIKEFEEVVYLVLATGSYELFLEVVCKDHRHLLNFLLEKLYRVPGVERSETFIYLEILKETTVPVPKEDIPLPPPGSGRRFQALDADAEDIGADDTSEA